MDIHLTIDRIFELAAEQGLKPQRWGGRPLIPYAGFTHPQRLRKLQACKLGIAMGLIPPASHFPCDICGKITTESKNTVGWHTEDYSKMIQYPLCRSCHTMLHMRFRHPNAWRDLLAKYEDGAKKWFESI